MTSLMPPLTPAAELAVLRNRYPDGLICTSPEPCSARLLASTPAGWSKSWPGLPEIERLALRDSYVCAECRQAAAERERANQARRQNLVLARQASAKPHADGEPGSSCEGTSEPRMNSGDSRRVSLTVQRRGGRPRKHATKQIRDREAQRARRARQRAGAAA